MQLCVNIVVDPDMDRPLRISKYCQGVVFWTSFLHIHTAIVSTIVYSNRFGNYRNNLQLGRFDSFSSYDGICLDCVLIIFDQGHMSTYITGRGNVTQSADTAQT